MEIRQKNGRDEIDYMIGSESRLVDLQYIDMIKKKKDRAKLRRHISWSALRLACISLSAKRNCADCGEENVLPSHIAKHAGRYNNLFNTVIALIKTNDSLTNLAGLDDEILKKCWILYKKNFKFKPRRLRNIII